MTSRKIMTNQTQKPNILFLFSDQHSARVLGCYGNDEVHTPHLDRLAEKGVRLDNAYCNNPICTPSRMSFLSGQYCHNHGHYGLMGPTPRGLPSLFSHFKEHGYRTGLAGKVHTPSEWLPHACDFFAEISPDLEEASLPEHLTYSCYQKERQALGLEAEGAIPEWRKLHPNGNQGLDARASTIPEDGNMEAWSAQKTIEFLESVKEQDQPFCFWMSMPRPHQTYLPAQRFWDLYDENELTLPPNADNDFSDRSKPARTTQHRFQNSENWRVFEPKDWESTRRRVLRGYYGCVSQVDDAVGQVIQHLEASGMRENTLIVYSTDHGEFAGEHGMIEKAPGIGFRCVTRIPQIWSMPGKLPEGVSRQSLVESVDFFPTVCRIAGLPVPSTVDGSDITELLENDKSIHDFVVTENALTKTIHERRFKLTQYLPEMHEGKDFGELFDIENDPWEMKNLYFDPEYQHVVQDLRLKLYGWLIRSMRNVTVAPTVRNVRGLEGKRSWDDVPELFGADGKIDASLMQEIVETGNLNYM